MKQGHAESFRRVVEIYAPMVRASARRCLGPFAHLSDDVAQTVFLTLARKAARLAAPSFQPGPWLYRQTVRQALNLHRAESRRTRREIRACDSMNSSSPLPMETEPPPDLDHALSRLRAADRDAVVMRYLEGRGLAPVALALGVSEEAARKRISRALESLRQRLTRHSRKVTPMMLAGWLATPETGAASELPIQTLCSKIEAEMPAYRGAPGQWSWSGVGWGLACGGAISAFMIAPPRLSRTGTTIGPDSPQGAASALTGSLTAEHLAASRGLDDVLEALRKTAHFPKNEITKLTRQGIVNRAAQSQWPTLAGRAVKRWQDEELEGALGSLLITWGKHSPEAALRFVKEHELGERIFSDDCIMGWEWGLYTGWASRDLTAASAWLLSEISEPWLQRSTLSGRSGAEMADFTLHALNRQDFAVAIAWAERLPVGPTQRAALEGLADDDKISTSNSGWSLAEQAADIALTLPGKARRPVLGLLIPLWAAAHGPDCIPWLAGRVPSEIGMDYKLRQLGESALRTWIAADTAGFNQWTAEKRKSYPPVEDWHIHGIISDWMPRLDIAAAALASASSGVISTMQDKPFLRALQTPKDALKLTGAIDQLVAKDPRGIHPHSPAARFYRNLLDRLPAVDSPELRQWLAAHTGLSSNENPIMLAECLNAAHAPDPGKAATLLMKRNDAMPMEMRLATVITSWSRRDPAAAAAWLDAHGTGPETWQAREKAGAA